MILQGEFKHWTQESSPCQGVSTNRKLREKNGTHKKIRSTGLLCIIELLKNSIVAINKTASIVHFNETETNEKLIFQQL